MGIQRLESATSFVTLGWLRISVSKFKRTENHNFTITTNTSQHVEFFHSLIFILVSSNVDVTNGYCAVFRKFWSNNKLAPPSLASAPPAYLQWWDTRRVWIHVWSPRTSVLSSARNYSSCGRSTCYLHWVPRTNRQLPTQPAIQMIKNNESKITFNDITVEDKFWARNNNVTRKIFSRRPTARKINSLRYRW